jgi:hypothetical protein
LSRTAQHRQALPSPGRPSLFRFSCVVSAWASLALAAIGCAHSQPEVSAPPAVTTRPASLSLKQRYAGTYVYAGTPAERAAVAAAVDTAVDGMGIATGFARSALMKRSEIRPTYTIVFYGKGDVGVETPGYPAEVSPSDGTEVKLTNRYGDESKVSQRFAGGALLQQGHTDQGKGETQFKLQPDGKTLVVKRVMQSSQLPRAVEFTLTYVRQQAN